MPKSPIAELDPPKPLKSRDRVLTDAEIKAFWPATHHDAIFGPFHRLLLLTAQRREEVAGMQWPELDLEKATWTIPRERTKNGSEHLVHLSPQAIAQLPNRGDSQFVLTTTGVGPINGYGKA